MAASPGRVAVRIEFSEGGPGPGVLRIGAKGQGEPGSRLAIAAEFRAESPDAGELGGVARSIRDLCHEVLQLAAPSGRPGGIV